MMARTSGKGGTARRSGAPAARRKPAASTGAAKKTAAKKATAKRAVKKTTANAAKRTAKKAVKKRTRADAIPGPLEALGMGLRGLWVGTARTTGWMARSVGKEAATAREIDPAHRRDGLGLLLVATAIVLACAVWFDVAGPVGERFAFILDWLLGLATRALPVLLVLWGIRVMRLEPPKARTAARSSAGPPSGPPASASSTSSPVSPPTWASAWSRAASSAGSSAAGSLSRSRRTSRSRCWCCSCCSGSSSPPRRP
nr:hypothetical protein GCM10025732_20630 [Glycomyces mayteni]